MRWTVRSWNQRTLLSLWFCLLKRHWKMSGSCSVPMLLNQHSAVCARSEHPPKPGQPLLAKLNCPVITGESAWPPSPQEGVDRALAERTLLPVQVKGPGWCGLPHGMILSKLPAAAILSFSRAQLLIKAADQHWSNHHLCVLWGPLVWQQPEQP